MGWRSSVSLGLAGHWGGPTIPGTRLTLGLAGLPWGIEEWGQGFLKFSWMRTGVPQMLQAREVFFFESFFRLIFEFLTNSVLQCIVKKGGPLNLWVNALVLKDERVPEFLTYRSIGSSSLPPPQRSKKSETWGICFDMGWRSSVSLGLAGHWGGPTTWDKVNLGFGRVALGYRGMRTGVPQILLNEDRGSSNAPGEGSVFFRVIFPSDFWISDKLGLAVHC